MEIIGKIVKQVLRNGNLNEELFEVISHNPSNKTYVVDLLDDKHRKTGIMGEISIDTVEVVDIAGLYLLSDE